MASVSPVDSISPGELWSSKALSKKQRPECTSTPELIGYEEGGKVQLPVTISLNALPSTIAIWLTAN